jgi:hypothetical protein
VSKAADLNSFLTRGGEAQTLVPAEIGPEPAALPDRVQIGPYEYRLEFDEAEIHRVNRGTGRHFAGQIRYHDGRIIIQPAQPDNRVRETVLHEVLHGILDMTGLDGDILRANAEPFITRFSPVLLDVLRRNPALVAYLTGDDHAVRR